MLFSPKQRTKPGPKGPSLDLIQPVVEMKQRNPRWGCPRIAAQIALAFGIPINKDVVRRILAAHYRPSGDGIGPSWLTFLSPLPVGFIYNAMKQPVLDVDKQVQQSLRYFFETFHGIGSALATVKAFRKQGLLFPRRPRHGLHKGDLLWVELTHSRAVQVLHNPRYAGAFAYGRHRTRRTVDGKGTCRLLPPDQWILLQDVHPGYISWDQYQANQRQLRENAQALGQDRKSAPREGPALLQGLVLCGVRKTHDGPLP